MVWKTALALIALAIPCAAIAETPITDAERAAIRVEVRKQLKDPDSARFRWLPSKAGDDYCGFVNARNSYGGYAGHTPFMVMLATGSKGPVAIFIGMGTANPGSVASMVIAQTCAEKGIDMRAATTDDPPPQG
jgi:hypothetical protein